MKNFCFSIFLSLRSEGKGRIIKEQNKNIYPHKKQQYQLK